MTDGLKLKTGFTSILLILVFFSMPAVADNHQGDIIIDEIVEWTTDQEINQNIHITSDGKLTISSVITFSSSSTIIIDQGGEIKLIGSSELISEKRATSLKTLGMIDEVNRSKIIIPTSMHSGEINVIINAEEGAFLDGSNVYIDGSEPILMSGMNFSVTIPEGQDDTTLGFTGYGQFPIIKSIILETDTGNFEYKANELPYQNMLLHGDNGLTINSAGKIELVENSTLYGVNIISSGEIIIKEGIIKDSSPMILTADSSSLVIQNSEISGSKDDHYVQAQPYSNIDWGNSEDGTTVSIKGHLIDRWERVISNQKIIFDSVGVYFGIIGTGPNGPLEITNYSGSDGKSVINDGGDYRTIEIGWANGEVTTENAVISIIEYRTAWNTESSGITNYGPTDIELTWEKEIDLTSINVPDIEWVSLTVNVEDSESDSEIRTGVAQQISAVLANRGTASANLFFDCEITETGMSADIGGYQNVIIDAGEEIEVFFGWRNIDAGIFGLTCEVLTPTQLVDFENSQAFGGGQISTESITWEEINDDSFNMIPILIVIIISMISGGVYFVHNLSRNAEQTAEILENYNKETGDYSKSLDED
ncbi:MAG: hypothetical protein CMB15_04835 [Euryarchaeota archaeon]|nr:hypothetical protein [Euryarchaeota archaeon]